MTNSSTQSEASPAEASGDVPIRPGPGHTAVYRFYDASGTLLYVGICDEPMHRWSQHIKKSWWADVRRFRLVWFPSRDEAMEAERRAIIAGKPIHNIALNGIPYQGSQFPVMHLHRITCEHFGDRLFSVRDLIDELGIPRGSAVSKAKKLRDEGLFEVVGKTKGRSGQDVLCHRAVPLVEREGADGPDLTDSLTTKETPMTATAIRRIGTCTEPATVLIEARARVDGLAYGALETRVYACDGHAHVARTEWVLPPLTPFSAIAETVVDRQCGDAIDAG